MKILIFNWRDIKNPRAGGAEVVTHEMAKRWVASGHQVTLFTASFPGAAQEEVIDGVRVLRRGKQWTVHWHAYREYQKNFKNKVDVVVDEINTIPFFTPLYVKEKKVLFINQLARQVWFYEAKFPLSIIGYLLEPLYLQVYKNIRTMTISNSTKAELEKMGIKKIDIVPLAVYFDAEQSYLLPKEKELTLIFVGRMVASKRPEEVIKAFKVVNSKYSDAKLWMVGGGEEKFIFRLKNLVSQLGLNDSVSFLGFVSQSKKYELMARAHLITVTSIKEGWGLIVTEANAVKTPAVVYDVDGLRDAVKNETTGLVVKENPQSLAAGILRIWGEPNLLNKLQEQSYLDSKKYSWEMTAKVSLAIITNND